MPVWKRAVDVFCIVLGLPLLVPLMLLLAAFVKCVSRGPVLFRQDRVGYRGRRFTCYKYRSMHVNASTEAHQQHLIHLMNADVPMVKLDSKGDRRLIPLGSLFRATGLDELPQLLNVLRGEMSLVGPRPCLPYEYEHYQPRQKRRFEAVPGLTGLWQVSGKNKTTFAEMINLDIFYVAHKSFWLDLAIMLRTIPAVILQAIEAQRRRKSTTLPREREVLAPAPEFANKGLHPGFGAGRRPLVLDRPSTIMRDR
jgi:lipopolysaccharide/colanic/teichoic acid biosynthesis glycosyltransferase